MNGSSFNKKRRRGGIFSQGYICRMSGNSITNFFQKVRKMERAGRPEYLSLCRQQLHKTATQPEVPMSCFMDGQHSVNGRHLKPRRRTPKANIHVVAITSLRYTF